MPTTCLAIYELLSILDPTELMDIAPAYMISTLYLMHKKVKERIRARENRRPSRDIT